MRPTVLKLTGWGCAVVVSALLLAEGATRFKHRQEVDAVPDEQKISRTLEIIRTSTPADHKVLKVLFYGQSITRSGWHNAVVAHWREKYPNTVFVVENRAIGGFASQSLVRAAPQDIAAFYPDLIVFHVYGDHHAYESILRMFRSMTAADVILQTDHGDLLPDPPCAEGLSFALHSPPGCSGKLWVHQSIWHDEMSYHKIPAFAKKYGMAMEPQHIWWRDYLLQTHLPAESLLRDGLHPNDKGNALIAAFFNRYFDHLVDNWNGETEKGVTSIPVPALGPEGKETVAFDGNRVELISSKPLPAWPSVTIDGIAAQSIDGCYQVTRSSPIETYPDWPAARRITLQHDHMAEDWTATVTDVNPDQKSFSFQVKGSASGDQGRGTSSGTFTSKSGQLSIDGQDWMFGAAYDLNHLPLKVSTEVHWSVQFVCGGEPEAIDKGNGMTQYRYVLGTGLANGKHTAQLSFPANDLADVNEFRAYTPSLHAD